MAEKLALGNSYTTDISSYSLADVDILLCYWIWLLFHDNNTHMKIDEILISFPKVFGFV
jgi:hypothetical protein